MITTTLFTYLTHLFILSEASWSLNKLKNYQSSLVGTSARQQKLINEPRISHMVQFTVTFGARKSSSKFSQSSR
jgi:hypothetical protein